MRRVIEMCVITKAKKLEAAIRDAKAGKEEGRAPARDVAARRDEDRHHAEQEARCGEREISLYLALHSSSTMTMRGALGNTKSARLIAMGTAAAPASLWAGRPLEKSSAYESWRLPTVGRYPR